MTLNVFKAVILVFGISSSLIAHELAPFPEPLIPVTTQDQLNEIPAIVTSPIDYLKSPNPENVTRLIFIRHGESTGNVANLYAGRTIDADLTEKGIKQAQEAGEFLHMADIDISAAYSSPMKRTNKTGKFVLSTLQPHVDMLFAQDERLHERWVGRFEGTGPNDYMSMIQKELAEIPLLQSSMLKFQYKPFPEIESPAEVYARVRDFISDAVQEHPGENLIVFSHAGLLKSLFIGDVGYQGYEIEYRSIEALNCSIMVLEVDAQGNPHVVATKGVRAYQPKQ